MSNSTAELKSYRAEDFLSPENLDLADATVTEIFKLMFGFDIMAVEPPISGVVPIAGSERTAIVGFSGAMRGSCQVRISTIAAQSIASAMLGGVPIDEDDDSINDALGELCNMLAGGWKNGVPELSSECALSPPTVISGCDYKVHVSKPSINLSRIYQFDAHMLYLTLCREEIGTAQI
jgi:chemotaxis protein CheX